MRMVNCERKYWPFVLELRNLFRDSFFNKNIISMDEHIEFMEKYSDTYYICITDVGIPMGWVGVVDNDMRVATNPVCQNRGVGKFMLAYAKEKHPDATAQIFDTNHSSLSIFRALEIPVTVISS